MAQQTFSMDKQVDMSSTTYTDNKVETLPEGDYAGKVVRCTLKRKVETKSGPTDIFEILVEIESKQYTITYWLNSDGNMKRCLTSLKRIGFQVTQWGPDFGRPYPDELQKAAAEMQNKMLSFTRGTSSGGYKTIGLTELSDFTVTATNAGTAFIDHNDLPF